MNRLRIMLSFVMLLMTAMVSRCINPETTQQRAPRIQADICDSQACRKSAEDFRASMDFDADPCNNFYQYACGGWIKQHAVPSDNAFYSQFHVAAARMQEYLRVGLEINNKTDRSAVRKAKIYYKSCLSESVSDNFDMDSILDFVQELGGLHIPGVGISEGEAEEKTRFQVESYLGLTKLLKDVSPIVDFDIRVDDTNSTYYVIALDQPQLLMPSPEFYTSSSHETARQTYIEFLTEFYGELQKLINPLLSGSTVNQEDTVTLVRKILALETDLARIFTPADQRVDVLKNFMKTTVAELSETLSADFNWTLYIHSVMRQVDNDVPQESNIAIYSKKYLKLLPEILKRHQPAVIRNYVLSSMLISRIDAMPMAFRKSMQRLRKVTNGNAAESVPWKKCVRSMTKSFPMPVASMYIQTHFSEEKRIVVNNMVDNIILTFKDLLRHNSWMDEDTKRSALEKAIHMEKIIGYPDYIIDDSDPKLDHEFEGVEMLEDQFFRNDVEIQKFFLKSLLKKAYQIVQDDSWEIGPIDIDAYYERNSNMIIFPSGILQPPFFDVSRPFSMMYGAIGNAIAHEVTHGFDTSGSRFDKIGNLLNWWSNSSRTQFEKASDCLREQYHGFFYSKAESFVNGNMTVNENIADNGGIRVAYQAYQSWRGTYGGQEFSIPGFEYFTSPQLYFIAMAQNWCSVEKKNFARKFVTKSTHSPPAIRVQGMLTNFEEFGIAFGCKKGKDILYPEKENTCRVW